jgi:hypothetical protein
MTALLELQVVREDVDVLHVQRDGQNHLTEEDRITYAIELSYRIRIRYKSFRIRIR